MQRIYNLVLSLCVVCVSSCVNTTTKPDENHIDLSFVEPGDLLFRKGQSLSSRIVLEADDGGDYSHIGMAVDIDGVIMVAHATPGDSDSELIRIEDISDFYKSTVSTQGAICRYAMDSIQMQIINDRAIDIVKRKTMFDNSYDTESQEELYCTEFVWEVYKSIDIDLSQSRRAYLNLGFISTDVILPSHIYNNEHVKLIHSF